MISGTARAHGAFFVMLFEEFQRPISVQRISEVGSGYYLLDGKVPVYLKLSTKRKGPWYFNFFHSHQTTQQTLFEKYGECITCLICGQDGIVGLSMSEFREVLDQNFEEQENVTVRRKLKTMYEIKGRDGALNRRVSRGAVFEKLKDTIQE
ncbi:hypothetical protein [Thalassospira sp. MCCC 1A03138]|uniref:hypothetical protein n=1 Tax=Thalassospira sp. MCCC 1A03138 TaxID=1470576 RepID=UPI000A1E9B3C|nr:hypothetical protein [Thalassospira sp. MCCC 1A03138]OSQ32834.1 hypothetical protein TH468_04745 [Thalassospira sp. MCCC 1A03138]